MSFRCQICRAKCSGRPQTVTSVKEDGNIDWEIAVCTECHEDIEAGVDPGDLVEEFISSQRRMPKLVWVAVPSPLGKLRVARFGELEFVIQLIDDEDRGSWYTVSIGGRAKFAGTLVATKKWANDFARKVGEV